jgi:hypothetical protein
MTSANYEAMELGDLPQYILTHREDVWAFHVYIDRSKQSGRMISIDPTESPVVRKFSSQHGVAIIWRNQ